MRGFYTPPTWFSPARFVASFLSTPLLLFLALLTCSLSVSPLEGRLYKDRNPVFLITVPQHLDQSVLIIHSKYSVNIWWQELKPNRWILQGAWLPCRSIGTWAVGIEESRILRKELISDTWFRFYFRKFTGSCLENSLGWG